MLDEIGKYLDAEKRSDLVNRLNNKRVEQSLPAEAELAVLWMLRDLEVFEIEPFWWAEGKKPDLYVEGLIPVVPSVVEVTAVSDNSMSGEKNMDSCARELMRVADKFERGIGKYLYFTFSEAAHRKRGIRIREILAPKEYRASPEVERIVRDWILSGRSLSQSLAVIDSGITVRMERRAYKHVQYHNFHTSRPPRTYSDTANPIYEGLSKKLSQVEFAPKGTWRIIVIFDAGSRNLANLAETNWGNGAEAHSTATSIIERFVRDKKGRVDAVVAVVPVVKFGTGLNIASGPKKRWHLKVFGEKCDINTQLASSLDAMIKQLPPPRFTGYNAMSMTRQRALSSNAIHSIMSTEVRFREGTMTFRISSRVFQEFLSGRISEEAFRRLIGEEEQGPSMKRSLNSGYTIASVRLEPSGVDFDDDHLVFDLKKDPSISEFE